MKTLFPHYRFVLGIASLVFACLGTSCGKIKSEGTVNGVQEINDLVVLKARFADIIEAEDNDMKITYIARMEAYYAVDYSKIDFKTTTTNIMDYGQLQERQFVTVKVPSIHLLSEPTLVREKNDKEGSEVFDIEGGTGKSAGRLKSFAQEAAVKLAKVEAGKESWMKLAREAAEDCIKQLYVAGKDPNDFRFTFDWKSNKLQNPTNEN